MTIFQALYCYSYQHSLDKNTNASLDSLRKTGSLMVSVMILMWMLSIAFLTLPFGLGEPIIDGFQAIFGYKNGKLIGQFAGFGLLVLIRPIVHLTIGSQKSFQQIIKTYEALDQETRSNTAIKGFLALAISIGLFVVIVIGSSTASLYT